MAILKPTSRAVSGAVFTAARPPSPKPAPAAPSLPRLPRAGRSLSFCCRSLETHCREQRSHQAEERKAVVRYNYGGHKKYCGQSKAFGQ